MEAGNRAWRRRSDARRRGDRWIQAQRYLVARGSGLPQQGARRLLEDLAPRPGLVLLGGEVLDDLAHARGRDLDPVALADLAKAVVVLGELEGHRFEAMLGHLDAAREVEDRGLEHELVVGLGL